MTEAADRVADRDLVGRLLLRFGADQLLDRPAGLGETLLDPGERQREGRTTSLQAACKFGDERSLTIGGFERAMSAITRIRLFGSLSAISISLVGPVLGLVQVDPERR